MSVEPATEGVAEMEAAEALTGLAHGVPGRKRRSGNGKRRIKVGVVDEGENRVKIESSPVDSALTTRPDLVQETSGYNTGKLKMEVDDAAFPHQKCATALRNVAEVEVKAEQDSISPDSQNQMCSTSYLSLGGGRSRHDLSETEKEAKRIRRVLANRESARRTIRRRQALCEDLTSRAAELTEENQRLKKTKELALKENKSLETTNKNLKAQIASTELKPALLNAFAPSANCQMVPYDCAPGQIFWPSRIHSSANGNFHEGTFDAASVTPSITAPSLCRRDLPHEQEKLLNMAGPGPPVYMVPCPWFVTSHGKTGNVDEFSVDNRTCASSSLGSSDPVNDSPVTIKAEPPDFIVGDLNEVPIESPPLGSSSQSDMIPKFAKFLKLGSETSHDNEVGLDLNYGGMESVNKLGNIQQTVLPGKKLGDSFAATEARRRRREITRLKSINGRKC